MKKKMKDLAVLLAAAALMVCVLSVGALADDGETGSTTGTTPDYLTVSESSKTITVTNDSTTTAEIQTALTYIDENASDKTGWTILVNGGLYSTYTVPDGVSVTVKRTGTTLLAVSDDIGYTVDQTGITVDSSNKIITVSDADNETYEIQNAIDYAVTQSDTTGWTIVVNSGTYSRFVVYDGMDI